ncbi:helix-turn-helix domain-containing protein [Aequorivita xiaoshiensis]|uniref:Helix-turn-helix transcriptional regulator n=1 Tax=Aequorivita xiaoshiensis TaxID=2874476 RepID=A0A9X1R159_9FLAO|nr:helix-turn-helix transcriptional regulator [Aequorivita xiaoshiensis]MCG2429922.1 helix-turn-helix transcriptional regulator [Aequorivita xiaoshiensis]
MPIIINLDVLLQEKGMTGKELAEIVGITEANLSIFRSGKARAVRFTTLESICEALDCQPGAILEFTKD